MKKRLSARIAVFFRDMGVQKNYRDHPSGAVTVIVISCIRLFLRAVAVAVAELVDAACGVDEFLLAGEEGVGA